MKPESPPEPPTEGLSKRRPAAFTILNRSGWALAAVVVVAIGVIWYLDRAGANQTPQWDTARFETVRPPLPADAGGDETWVVAVQLRCPHCRESLGRVLHATRDHDERIAAVALLVDTDALPGADLMAHVADAEAVYWDREGLWRRRWGRSRWGEVMCFGRDGRLLRVLAPLEDSAAVPRAVDEMPGDAAPSAP